MGYDEYVEEQRELLEQLQEDTKQAEEYFDDGRDYKVPEDEEVERKRWDDEPPF